VSKVLNGHRPPNKAIINALELRMVFVSRSKAPDTPQRKIFVVAILDAIGETAELEPQVRHRLRWGDLYGEITGAGSCRTNTRGVDVNTEIGRGSCEGRVVNPGLLQGQTGVSDRLG
jgi:hypothetical protein